MNKKSYETYLLSPEWSEKRNTRIEYDNHQCQTCLSTDDLEVHHRTYERFGNEDLNDLVTLCEECHKAITNVQRHKKYKKKAIKLIKEAKSGIPKIKVKTKGTRPITPAQQPDERPGRLLRKRDEKNIIKKEQNTGGPRRISKT